MIPILVAQPSVKVINSEVLLRHGGKIISEFRILRLIFHRKAASVY